MCGLFSALYSSQKNTVTPSQRRFRPLEVLRTGHNFRLAKRCNFEYDYDHKSSARRIPSRLHSMSNMTRGFARFEVRSTVSCNTHYPLARATLDERKSECWKITLRLTLLNTPKFIDYHAPFSRSIRNNETLTRLSNCQKLGEAIMMVII